MKRTIKIIFVLATIAIAFVGCHPTNHNTISQLKPAKYEVTSAEGTPVKVNITYIGRINQLGEYTSTDPQAYTVETVTPWEYTLMTCKDFTYSLIVEYIDTVNVNLIGKVVINDVTVAEQSGEKIILKYEE